MNTQYAIDSRVIQESPTECRIDYWVYDTPAGSVHLEQRDGEWVLVYETVDLPQLIGLTYGRTWEIDTEVRRHLEAGLDPAF